MINAITPDNFKNINKVSIIDAKSVFYPLQYVLQKRDIQYDEDLALVIIPMVDDVKYPATSKNTDAGLIRDYKVELSTNNQSPETEEKMEQLQNKKVIVVLHHNHGKIIIGCNDMPLDYNFTDDNSSNPAQDSGFTVSCRGNSYYLKVSI